LKAFVQTTLNKRFYNLKRVKYKGLQTEIELGFDESKVLTREQIAQRKQAHPELVADVNFTGNISACGAPNDLPEFREEQGV
jgi:anaerobic magnesium-protoporphyrin IX monomethyl ester cyclase